MLYLLQSCALLYDLIRYHITNLKPQQCLFFCEVQIIVQMSEVVMRKRYALMQLFQKMIQLHLIRIPAPQKENIQRIPAFIFYDMLKSGN